MITALYIVCGEFIHPILDFVFCSYLTVTFMHADIIQDELLQEQLHAGDEQALFSLVLLYYNDLFRYALKFTAEPELTKELVNQFFIHAWENRSSFSGAKKLQPYLMVSFKRFLIAWHRTSQKNAFSTLEDIDLSAQPYEEYIISLQRDTHLKEALHEAIQSLSRRQKQLVHMRFYEQLTYEQISATTSLSIRTIYNKINIALKKLRSNKLLQRLDRS